MYKLIFIATISPVYLGEYQSLDNCRSAIKQIYQQKLNLPNVRLEEINKIVDIKMQYNKEFVCIKSE
jgi:hypothetical protein